MPSRPNDEELLRAAVDLIEEKKGERPVAIDLREDSIPTSYFVVTSGDNSAHVKAIVSNFLEKFPVGTFQSEGTAERRWVILDYGEIVVHVFLRETRDFYDIESLWADRIVPLPARAEPAPPG